MTNTKSGQGNYIDFHTHVFPDVVAQKAVPKLEKMGNIKAQGNGTLAGLLASMESSNIARSVVCSIATKPEQFEPILQWSQGLRSERIIPLPSLHPQDPDLLPHLEKIHSLGFQGVKMHPYYQDYLLDDPKLNPLYARMAELNLLLVIHAGYDIGYPRVKMADPQRILKVCRQFPELKLIATHLGGWNDWEDVRRLLVGLPIYMELSFAPDCLESEALLDILRSHPADYLLFGTDWPWRDQEHSLNLLRALDLPDELFCKISSKNAEKLLTRIF